MDLLFVLVIIVGLGLLVFVGIQLSHGKKINEIDDVLRELVQRARGEISTVIHRNDTPTGLPPISQPPPPMPPVADPKPPAADPAPAPAATPTELAPAYIDEADFYKALGAAVAAGYSGGVYLNGKMEHNGFGPFDYYEKTANGNVVRTTRPTTVPAPVPAPVATDVAIGSE